MKRQFWISIIFIICQHKRLNAFITVHFYEALNLENYCDIQIASFNPTFEVMLMHLFG